MRADDEHTIAVEIPTAAAIRELNEKLDAILERIQTAPKVGLEEYFARMLDGPDALGFDPLRVYDAKEVAYLLGAHPKSVNALPQCELPKVRRIGRNVGYHGINVLAYMLGRDPVDVDAAFDRFREKILKDRPTVHNMNGGSDGLTRVH